MVDIPFVSEDFQRSYRNRFPSQTSTGRDLHVSDVVVPVVDFTPTASGTSLPINLRQARSTGTAFTQLTAAVTDQDLITTTGFYSVFVNSQLSADNTNGAWLINLTDGSSTNQVAGSYMLLGNTTDGVVNLNEHLILYIPQNYKATLTFSEGTGVGAISIYSTQIADVNGNEVLPPLYSPQ
jgi:hypothetical protein